MTVDISPKSGPVGTRHITVKGSLAFALQFLDLLYDQQFHRWMSRDNACEASFTIPATGNVAITILQVTHAR